MTVSIIRLDGRVIGLAPANPGDQGLGVLTWFHLNKAAYSMDHATRYEGYSVDAPGELDCGDVESIIAAICDRAGLTMESVFVPFSQSRNAKGDSSMGDGKPWESLNWRVTFKRGGREILTTDYAQGSGYTPAFKLSGEKLKTAARHYGRPEKTTRAAMVSHEIETGRVAKAGFLGMESITSGAAIPAPSIGDVLQSLASDSAVLDAGGFDEWAADFGYDTDSRKAESTYRACVEIATKLRAGLGEALLSEIRLAASFN